MIDLKKYFDDNVKKYDYYNYKFSYMPVFNSVSTYILFDDYEVITKFKEYLYPYNVNKKTDDIDNEKFIYLCFYLNSNNYHIKEFPNFLERPTNRWNFSNDIIRNELIKIGNYNGVVPWADRRAYIDSLSIEKKDTFIISNDVNIMLKKISTRDAEFQKMSKDEKLKEICNCIEFLLKDNGKFTVLNYNNSCGYLSDNIVKDVRNKLECFRHATQESLKDRSSFSESQKDFLIDYGILILDYINKNKLKEVVN